MRLVPQRHLSLINESTDEHGNADGGCAVLPESSLACSAGHSKGTQEPSAKAYCFHTFLTHSSHGINPSRRLTVNNILFVLQQLRQNYHGRKNGVWELVQGGIYGSSLEEERQLLEPTCRGRRVEQRKTGTESMPLSGEVVDRLEKPPTTRVFGEDVSCLSERGLIDGG